MFERTVLFATVGLVLARLGIEWWLEELNQRHVRAHSGRLPAALAGVMDEATFARAVDYTLANSRFGQVRLTAGSVILLAALLSGLLPWLHSLFDRSFGDAAWAQAAFLLATGFLLGLPGLPFDWYDQFHLEQRFGFNTSTPATWWMDRIKEWILGAVLGWPLLWLILKLVEWMGASWWLWAWGSFMAFQLLIMVLAPVLILPLFNKLTPLPEGALRDRLLTLADRAGFMTRGIQVMDGSRRSRHSNAFFTGFGRFRRIVLFDTLIEQLDEAELEAVLAHEIGHYKLRHIPKTLALSTCGSLLSFYALSVLAEQSWFAGAFGFAAGKMSPVLLLFGLLAGTVGFWVSPLFNRLSRRHEYEADAFAAKTVGTPSPLVGALRKLSEKNLSNLTPHPLYSGFHYSHPTLLERESALSAQMTNAQ